MRLATHRVVTVFWAALALASPGARACELGVYTYDSIAGKGGLGPLIFPEFERQSGCKVRVLTAGDAIQALSRAEIDSKRGALSGDVLLGVDPLMWKRVSALAATSVPASSELEPVVRKALPAFPGFYPYDYGPLALIADTDQLARSGASAPKSLSDLTRPELQRSLVLEDPRTSSPGLQFLLFTKKILGPEFAKFWHSLRGQWLAMPAGWDAAYSIFLKGEAPFVWSYVTSEAYHREHGSGRYQAILFREGQPVQIEGAVLLKNGKNAELARRFLEFLQGDFVQARVAATNWMWPVRRKSPVPPSFSKLPSVEHAFVLSGENSEAVLKEWSEAVHE